MCAFTNNLLQPPLLGNGLVGWWKMDEGTGLIARDTSGNGNDGTLVNSPLWVSGRKGKALSFNGSNQKIFASNISDFSNFGTNDFSISFWINPSSSWTGTQGIIGQKTNDSSPGFQIYHDSHDANNLRFRAGDDLGHIDVNSPTILSNQWSFCICLRRSGMAYCYINGSTSFNDITNAKNISGSTANFNIGYADTWGAYFNGSLDDIRIFNRALSSKEITLLYNSY